jgi:hypothetical protein
MPAIVTEMVEEKFAKMELLNIANNDVMHRCRLGTASPGEMEACGERVLAINNLMEDVVAELRAHKGWYETQVSQWIHQDYDEATFKGWPGRKLAKALEFCVLVHPDTTPEKRKTDQSYAAFLLLQLKEKQGPVHMAALTLLPWTCKFCTLHNSANVRICDVCGKARDCPN